MVFVTLGTQKFQMNRLLKAIDEQKSTGQIQDEIFAQIGYSDYAPQHFEYRNFLKPDDFNDQIQRSEIVVTHSGVSTIMKSLLQKKKVIVVPRRAKFGEHVDDHQIEIARTFSELNYVYMALDIGSLYEMLTEIKTYSFDQYISGNSVMIKTIEDYLKSQPGEDKSSKQI